MAAPCIGPFVLGLLTYVGQRHDPAPRVPRSSSPCRSAWACRTCCSAIFTGALDKLPNSGAWMLGVRKLFGVLLVGLAAYFLTPLRPGAVG